MTTPSGTASRMRRRHVCGMERRDDRERKPPHRDEPDDHGDEKAGRRPERGGDEPAVRVVRCDEHGSSRVRRERDRPCSEIEDDSEAKVETRLEGGRDRHVHTGEDHRDGGEDDGGERSVVCGIEREDGESSDALQRPTGRGEARSVRQRSPPAVSPRANQRTAVPLSPNSDSEMPISRNTVRTVKRPYPSTPRKRVRMIVLVAVSAIAKTCPAIWSAVLRRTAGAWERSAAARVVSSGRLGLRSRRDLGVHAPHVSIGIDDHGDR